jgi:hypothetical protein
VSPLALGMPSMRLLSTQIRDKRKEGPVWPPITRRSTPTARGHRLPLQTRRASAGAALVEPKPAVAPSGPGLSRIVQQGVKGRKDGSSGGSDLCERRDETDA